MPRLNATISILANRFRPSVDRRLDDTAFGARTFSWRDPIHSWKAGTGTVMTAENLFIDNLTRILNKLAKHGSMCAAAMAVLTCAATQGLSNQTCITV